ncbi:PepSY domain-containing protein [Arthrobacter sp. NicSoilC12]|uniref:PepSY domain-containing protein n=1 Tax=Arthrobacter sp. NicSoilC12 TaxID=2831001 RepID=UPI001CC43036|nr:PepSY domain-containing protein [Arthrobacter sp. NicSoilC12]GIU57758.1 hypothetical protein NicSoilC12_35070 [Arthrobacter sp. NicSoilC12]
MIDAGKVEIKPPAKEGKAWTVTQADAVAVDPATMTVSGRLVFNDFNVAAKLTRWGIDAHMGVLFGLANQIVLPAIALGLAGSVIGGYLMWWKCRPIRGTAWAAGRPPARRFLRTASWPLTAASPSSRRVTHAEGWFKAELLAGCSTRGEFDRRTRPLEPRANLVC